MDRMLYDVRQDAIEKSRNSEEREQKRLIDIAVYMIKLSQTVRREGLLSLEDAMQKCKDEFAKRLMLLTVDGTKPDRLLEIATNAYWVEEPLGIEAMVAYFCICGVLFIQEGENDFVMEQTFQSLIPQKWQQEYIAKMENQKKETALIHQKEISEKFDKICPKSPNAHLLGNIHALEKEIETLSDRELQRLLRDVDSHSLAACVYALNQVTRERILSNLSQRLVNKIKESVVEGEFEDEEMIVKTVLKVQSIVNTLREVGEIKS